MEFRENQAIYLQIADLMCENILAGTWKPGDRIPSIRELAESIQVNPNTVMRTYGYMEEQGIIHNQRGIGFFLLQDAYETTRELKRKSFVSRDLPQVFRTMDLLRLGLEDLQPLYAAHGETRRRQAARTRRTRYEEEHDRGPGRIRRRGDFRRCLRGIHRVSRVDSPAVRPVVFLGDFNVDLIMDGLTGVPRPDHEVSCSSFDIVMGASCCIAAAAYARMGGAAAVCGLSGTDDLGAFMRARLREAGVRTGMVARDPGRKTGVTVNIVQETGRSPVTFPGAMGAFSAEHIPAGLFRRARHFHIAGVYQAGALLPDVAGVLARATDAGATTSLDCQWDPTEKWQNLDGWLPRLDWLFVNEQEAKSMTGETEPSRALRALASRTRRPVLKAGPAGAWVMEGDTVLHVPGHSVTVVDTIGAGDTFDAGFLFAVLEKDMETGAAVRFANAAAARSCAFRGGTAAASTFRDVMTFLEGR